MLLNLAQVFVLILVLMLLLLVSAPTSRGHIDQLLSNYPKPKHIRFDSLSVNICIVLSDKWDIYYKERTSKKMTGRLRTIQYQKPY